MVSKVEHLQKFQNLWKNTLIIKLSQELLRFQLVSLDFDQNLEHPQQKLKWIDKI